MSLFFSLSLTTKSDLGIVRSTALLLRVPSLYTVLFIKYILLIIPEVKKTRLVDFCFISRFAAQHGMRLRPINLSLARFRI